MVISSMIAIKLASKQNTQLLKTNSMIDSAVRQINRKSMITSERNIFENMCAHTYLSLNHLQRAESWQTN